MVKCMHDIASIKGLEKTWDRFLSQRLYHYSGTVPLAPGAKNRGNHYQKLSL